MDLDSKKEAILDELTGFEKRSNELNEIPEILDEYLIHVAKTGDPSYPWCKVKPLIKKKIELVVNEFNEKYPSSNITDLPNCKQFNLNEMKVELIEHLDTFNGSPFTLQRICELLTSPYKHYKRADKFMRGLEKNILVVSTIEPKSQRNFSQNSNHKPFFLPNPTPSSSSYQNNPTSSSTSFVNGLHDSTSNIPHFSEYCDNLGRSSIHHSPTNNSHSPAPLQQLDSFTTVFVSPPSTPLAVVSDLSSFENNSASLSPEHNSPLQEHHSESNNNNHLEEHCQQSENLDDHEPCSSSSTESGNDSPLDSSPELNSHCSDGEEKQIEENVSTSISDDKLQDNENNENADKKDSQNSETVFSDTELVANEQINREVIEENEKLNDESIEKCSDENESFKIDEENIIDVIKEDVKNIIENIEHDETKPTEMDIVVDDNENETEDDHTISDIIVDDKSETENLIEKSFDNEEKVDVEKIEVDYEDKKQDIDGEIKNDENMSDDNESLSENTN